MVWLSGFFCGRAFGEEPKNPSIGSYAQIRSARICAFVDGEVNKCGTAIFIGRNELVTALHVVGPVEVPDYSLPAVKLDPQLPAVQLTKNVIPELMILRENAVHFEPAVLVSSYDAVDLATIHVGGLSPQAVLHDDFWRGERVWAVGNPAGRDFVVIPTEVVGIVPFQRGDHKGLVELISVDSKDNKITHGFSGGGLFTRDGMIGMIQMCEPEGKTCWALPTYAIEKELKGDK